jgi:hypothetical protein
MRRAALFAALAFLAPASARAVSAAGAAVLRLPLSADAAAMGGAYSGFAGGLSSLGVNPAGVAAATTPELETTFHQGLVQDAFGFLGYAHPLSCGVPFGGLAYYDAGSVSLSFSNGTQSTVVAERDYIGMLGWSMTLGGGLSAGVMARAFRFELAQQATATGFAGDAGVQWATPLKGLRLGAAVQNAGAGVKFEDATDPLPLTGRAGAAYTLEWHPDKSMLGSYYAAARFTTTADAVQTRGDSTYPAVGTEFAIDIGSGSIALRAGYNFDTQSATGISYGAGVREGRFSLDFAQVSTGELGNVQYGSFTIRF